MTEHSARWLAHGELLIEHNAWWFVHGELLTEHSARWAAHEELATEHRARVPVHGGLTKLVAHGGKPTIPEGFALTFASDNVGYVFAKDSTDPCQFSYSSDRGGLIYMGEAIC